MDGSINFRPDREGPRVTGSNSGVGYEAAKEFTRKEGALILGVGHNYRYLRCRRLC